MQIPGELGTIHAGLNEIRANLNATGLDDLGPSDSDAIRAARQMVDRARSYVDSAQRTILDVLADLATRSEYVPRTLALLGRQVEMVDQYICSAGTQLVLAAADEQVGDPEEHGSVAFRMKALGRAQNGAEEQALAAKSLARGVQRLAHEPLDRSERLHRHQERTQPACERRHRMGPTR